MFREADEGQGPHIQCTWEFRLMFPLGNQTIIFSMLLRGHRYSPEEGTGGILREDINSASLQIICNAYYLEISLYLCRGRISWIKTFVSINEMCQASFLILTKLWSSKIVFLFCKMSYRALTWSCGDRHVLLTENILQRFQSIGKEESLLLLTLLLRNAWFPKGFVLYL